MACFAGHQVWATTRHRSRAAALGREGINGVIADWADRRTLCDLPNADRVLVAVSFDRHAGRSPYESLVRGFANLLAVLPQETDVCYISTTGVYHQRDGSWVDERSPTRPGREVARVHLQAEELLWRLRPESPWTILRLAGIYGPGRVPRVGDVIGGRPIAASPSSFLNLIHVEDAARAVMAAWARSKHRLYLLGDDHPVVRGEFYREIARRCSASPPRFAEPTAKASGWNRSESNKRVWNRRMKRELIAKLEYPSFREGLASIL